MRISDWSSDVCSSDLQPFLVALAANDQIFAFARHGAARKRHEFARAETRPIEKFEQQQHSHRARGWRLAGRLLARLLEQPFAIAVRQAARQGPPRRGARYVDRRLARPPPPPPPPPHPPPP